MAENKQILTDKFSTDKPCLPENDAFYRLPFAKKIAETITKRDPQESIVIGISGAWGEGKTTLQGYIESEISKIDADCKQIKFNPWRIEGDEQIMSSFFHEVAKVIPIHPTNLSVRNKSGIFQSLKQKCNSFIKTKDNDSEYYSIYENILRKLRVFLGVIGKLLKFLPFVGDIAEAVKDLINPNDRISNEEKKSRLIKASRDNKKRTIIYIDDIDRLELNEIRYVFRLVKSTCDFPNLTYILFFDRNAVAAALNSTANNSESNIDGERYLEKIIQIPFDLPKIQKENLEKFLFERIDKVLKSIDIKLAPEEARRYKTSIKPILMYKISTPRSIFLYANVLSFGLNFLKSEVNIVDFMIIEALRLFYPSCYRLIKENPHFFIGTQLDTIYWFNQGSVNSHEYKVKFSAATGQIDEFEKIELDKLITELFPSRLVPGRRIAHNPQFETSIFKNKRIASVDYFERYFSYSTLDEASDYELENSLIDFFHKKDTKSIENLIEIQPDRFVKFLRAKESTFDSEQSIMALKLLSRNYSMFVNAKNNSIESLNRSYAENTVLGLIFLFLTRTSKKNVLFGIINDNNSNLRFLLMLRECIAAEDTFLSADEIKEFNKVILEVVKEEIILRNSLFEIRPQYLIAWLHGYLPKFDTEFYRTQVMIFLDKSQENIEYFFVTFLQTETGYLHDFLDDKYKALSEIFNMSYIYAKILEHTPKNEITNTQVQWRNNYDIVNYNIINIFRQFLSHYDHDE